MDRKLKIVGVVLCAIAFVGIAAGKLLLSHNVSTSLTVKPVVSMGVYDVDGNTSLTSIALGQFNVDSYKYFPGGSTDPPIQYYYINNTDQMNFYVSFTWSNLPPGSEGHSWFVWIRRGDQATFTKLNAGEIYTLPIITKLEDPDPAKQHAVWYFKFVIDVMCPFGTYSPTLTINAYDTASG